MTLADFAPMIPLIAVALGAVLALLAAAFFRRPGVSLAVVLASFAAGLSLLAVAWPLGVRRVGSLLIVDRASIFAMGLVLVSTLLAALISSRTVKARQGERGEYYALLALAALGASVLASSTHFATFFLGQEVLSVSLYSLIAYRRENPKAGDAGMKYLVLGGVSSSFLLFGMALLYADLGTMEFSPMAAAFSGGAGGVLSVCGFAMMVVGIGFKLAVVPFHLWSPDVYEGAPAPVAALVATTSKGAVFSLLVRFFPREEGVVPAPFFLVFALISGLSMIVGNVLALREKNVKRILAYSSIAHLGYLLVAFLAGGDAGGTAAAYYLVTYFAASIGSFGTVSALSQGDREADALEDFRGLAWRKPWLAGAFTVMLLSLAGLPLTAGFLGKLSLFMAGMGSRAWYLGVVLAAGSVVGLFYYLKLITEMFRSGGSAEVKGAIRSPVPVPAAAVLAFLTLVTVWLGIYPDPLLAVLRLAGGAAP